MTARSSGNARRAREIHAPIQALHAQPADPHQPCAGQLFDIVAYVKTSRRAQQLPETVDDPAVLERLISLLRVAELEKRRK